MVCSLAFGAIAASVSLISRALSSYMIIATRRPLSMPIMRSASKLPRWAPKASTPSPRSVGLQDLLDAVRLEAELVEALLQQVDAVEHDRGRS